MLHTGDKNHRTYEIILFILKHPNLSAYQQTFHHVIGVHHKTASDIQK
jgi:hypothetical protein